MTIQDDQDRIQEKNPDAKEEHKPATFTGDSTGSGPNTATGTGRGGDAIIQDDVVYGRPLSGRDRAEGDRATEQQGHERDERQGKDKKD